MIKYPENWKDIGHEISIDEIANAIQTCIYQLNIRNLSLSGGIDSTLLLYFMKKVLGDPINCYTITFDENHPDYIYAKMASEFFNVNFIAVFYCGFENTNLRITFAFKFVHTISNSWIGMATIYVIILMHKMDKIFC